MKKKSNSKKKKAVEMAAERLAEIIYLQIELSRKKKK